jgi:hypothetical protein
LNPDEGNGARLHEEPKCPCCGAPGKPDGTRYLTVHENARNAARKSQELYPGISKAKQLAMIAGRKAWRRKQKRLKAEQRTGYDT